ncbi:MAG TPA: DUF2911 domain-containing protein [Pyrinomonadaceae bacterium]|nr:DUF2911 domain-containing protein [Pyrinomonadaceae bacterium]
MRKTFLFPFVLILFLVSASASFAQLRFPQPSQKASVTQTVGVTDVTIVYSRPGVRGRKIWGDWPVAVTGEATLDDSETRPANAPIVPYGHIWRTGANNATQFTVTDDVLVNGQLLPAGTYSLHTIPNKDEWTIIFNSVAEQGGSFDYDSKKDVLRVKTKPEVSDRLIEWLDFSLDPAKENSLVARINWEKVSVPFTIEVKDLPTVVLNKARTVVAGAKSDDWQTPFQAANYARANKATDDAAKWYEQALRAIDEQIKVKSSYQNLQRRANTLLNLGRRDEGITAAEKAVEAGKAEKVDTSALEKRIAELKAATK